MPALRGATDRFVVLSAEPESTPSRGETRAVPFLSRDILVRRQRSGNRLRNQGHAICDVPTMTELGACASLKNTGHSRLTFLF
jgi:hypothetical protein